MHHVVPSLEFMAGLQTPEVFKFVAFPQARALLSRQKLALTIVLQIMAIATLSLCYNNHDVFTSVCKIRKGVTAKVGNVGHHFATLTEVTIDLPWNNKYGRRLQMVSHF